MRLAPVDVRTGLRTVWGNFNGVNGAISNPGSADWWVSKTQVGIWVLTFGPPLRAVPVCTGNAGAFGVVGFTVLSANQVQVMCWAGGSGAGLDANINFRFEGRALTL